MKSLPLAAVLALAPVLVSGAAHAQAAGGTGGIQEILPTILMFGLMFVVFYVLLIRPQQRKIKDQQAMLAAVRRGDRVVVGGLIGTVHKVVSDDELQIELADGVRVRALRAAISTVLAKDTKGEAAKEPAEDTPAA